LVDLSKLMQSTVTPYLLLIACEDNQLLDEETKDVFRTLFDTIKQKSNVKIIFITRSGGSTFDFLQHLGRGISGEGFVRRDEQLTWSDLTASSQEKLLKKPVKFQGSKISLNELMSAESPVVKFLPLGGLVEEKELKIADPVPISNGYNESYYVGRTFRHQNVIKQEIFSDKDVKEKRVSLASEEQEFRQLSQLNPKSNVHWLEEDKTGKLVWQRSQGSLETLRRYIDTDSSHTYTADDLDKLLEQAQKQRVMLISDKAGMGKSTVLTHLSKQIKQKFPAKWVVRIDLNDHTDALKALKGKRIDKEKAIEFVSEKVLKIKPGLEMELFKECCEQKQKVRTVIMVDGFDEISPFYKETVIDLLQAVRQTATEQLWITTRPHLRNELEDKLQQLSYTLQPFSEGDQIVFLRKFWSLKDWFTEPEDKEGEVEKTKLEIYAEHLIKELAQSISDKDRKFTGIPLQTRMLAEAFDKEVKTFYQSAEHIPDLQAKLELFELYERFIERKYDIYQEEKLQAPVSNVTAIEQREDHLTFLRMDHQFLALKVLFTEEVLELFQNNSRCKFSGEKLTRLGIVQGSHEGNLRFIHRTFAEFYVADCLVERLTEGNNTSEQVLDFILKDVFLEEDYRVIRVFMDGFLSRSKTSKEMLKQYGNRIHDLWNDYEKDILHQWKNGDLREYRLPTPVLLHRAVHEGNVNIIGFLIDNLQTSENTDIAKELLLSTDANGRTPWHQAVYSHNIQVSEKLWECAERNPRAHDLGWELLFAKDLSQMNAWHLAVEEGKIEVLLKQWELAKEKLSTRCINLVLFSKDFSGRTVWDMIDRKADPDQLQKLWEWAKKELTTEEIKSTLLFQSDFYRRLISGTGVWYTVDLTTGDVDFSFWHIAEKYCSLEYLQEIWEWIKGRLTTDEIYRLFVATESRVGKLWRLAALKDGRDTTENMGLG